MRLAAADSSGVEQAVDEESTFEVHPPTVADGATGRYAQRLMVLSDRTIREDLDAGRLVIEPFDQA